MKKVRIVPVLAIVALFSGCAANDRLIQKQTEMETRMEQLVQSVREIDARMADMSTRIKDIRQQADLNASDIREMKVIPREERVAELPVPGGSEPTNIQVVRHDGPQKEQDVPSTLYMKAFGLYGANKYAEAIPAFEEVITRFPDSDYAGNAQYWIGECHYSQSHLPEALEAFRKVTDKYSKSVKVPDAMLKAGFTLYAMKQPEKGKELLTSLIEKYPNSPVAAKAKERLKRH